LVVLPLVGVFLKLVVLSLGVLLKLVALSLVVLPLVGVIPETGSTPTGSDPVLV
jgi:hypothetical protein